MTRTAMIAARHCENCKQTAITSNAPMARFSPTSDRCDDQLRRSSATWASPPRQRLAHFVEFRAHGLCDRAAVPLLASRLSPITTS